MWNDFSCSYARLQLEYASVPKFCTFVAITITILLIVFYLKPWLRAVRLALNLPGPPALPILGNVLLIKDGKEFIELGRRVSEQYGLLFRSWVTVIPVVIVLDPKHLQVILSSLKLTDKNFLYSFMHTFIGPGLITSSGNKWRLHRKYIQPYFNLNSLETFIGAFSEGADTLVKELRHEKDVKITTFINKCIFDILHQAVLGIPIEDQIVKEQSPFSKGRVTITDRILRPWFLLNFVYRFTSKAKHEFEQQLSLEAFIKEIIEQKRQDKEQNKRTKWCLLEMFLEITENHPDFTAQDVINEVCTFMLAGQDSVRTAISFSLYYLAKHQDIQEKVTKELDEIYGESDNISTISTLNKMKYLEQCIKETMRLCPSVPIIARKLSEDVQLDIQTLPAGTNVFISPFVTQRLPNYFPEPEKFDPNRFSPSNQENRHPFAYIPFSLGPRNCIGYKFAMLEMKSILSAILRNYKISLIPGHEFQLIYRVILKAKGGIWLRLHPR